MSLAKRRELTESFEQGIQFGTCGACSWECRCPPLVPNDERSQGALDDAFDQHVRVEHPRLQKRPREGANHTTSRASTTRPVGHGSLAERD
jgi:hypothetical protein